MTTKTENTHGFAIVRPDDAEDAYAGTDVPGRRNRSPRLARRSPSSAA